MNSHNRLADVRFPVSAVVRAVRSGFGDYMTTARRVWSLSLT